MATSNKLTDKRLKEIAALPVTYDDDIPEFSDSDLKDFVPAHPEYFKVTPDMLCHLSMTKQNLI